MSSIVNIELLGAPHACAISYFCDFALSVSVASDASHISSSGTPSANTRAGPSALPLAPTGGSARSCPCVYCIILK